MDKNLLCFIEYGYASFKRLVSCSLSTCLGGLWRTFELRDEGYDAYLAKGFAESNASGIGW